MALTRPLSPDAWHPLFFQSWIPPTSANAPQLLHAPSPCCPRPGLPHFTNALSGCPACQPCNIPRSGPPTPHCNSSPGPHPALLLPLMLAQACPTPPRPSPCVAEPCRRPPGCPCLCVSSCSWLRRSCPCSRGSRHRQGPGGGRAPGRRKTRPRHSSLGQTDRWTRKRGGC